MVPECLVNYSFVTAIECNSVRKVEASYIFGFCSTRLSGLSGSWSRSRGWCGGSREQFIWVKWNVRARNRVVSWLRNRARRRRREAFTYLVECPKSVHSSKIGTLRNVLAGFIKTLLNDMKEVKGRHFGRKGREGKGREGRA